ncbi:MAG: alpha/beta fold hydrolase [Pseudomonadota bacterium]
MLPQRRNHKGQRVASSEAAMEAWTRAWSQMIETGTKAIKSNVYLAKTSKDEVEIAETPSDTVFQIDKVRVMRYRPLVEPNPDIPPVLICYGLFGRQTMIDLQEDRSLVRNLLQSGVDVYVVDWGNPTRADQFLNFDDYIDLYLGSCVDHVVAANSGKPITMFGICEGGTFAAALVADRPHLFAGLALAITPIDFHGQPDEFWAGEGFLNSWIGNLSEDDVDLIIDTYGMLPGAMTGAVFSSLTPIASMTKYNIGLAAMEGDDAAMLNFLRMEKWIADRPDHPGEAARQWLNDLYRDNQLVEGTFELCGKPVDLSKINCPVLNIYALQDHIIPVSCSKALGRFVQEDLYEEIGFPGGHVGVFVSRKAQGVVAGGLSEWMQRKLVAKPAKKAAPKSKPGKPRKTAAKRKA